MTHPRFSPWPNFSAEEADAVSQVLLTNKVNYWTGEEGRKFEKEYAAWCGTRHAVALANGTVALEAALKALGVGPGDEIIVAPRTFVATASCVANTGARPVFVDVDRDSGNISAATIAEAISPRTKAVICVHLGGWPCDMDPIMALAKKRGLYVIEDCAQAHGANYKGRNVGSIGHIGTWSFCQDKIITTGGEGGMITTDNKDLWQKVWSLKDHGKSYEAVYERECEPGFRWLHESFGSNWRMTEMQAVLGRMQLRKLANWHEKRTHNAKCILDAFRRHDNHVRVPEPPDQSVHAFYRCYVYLRPDSMFAEKNQRAIIDMFNSYGVPCYSGSCSEIYLEKAFDAPGMRPEERLPVARELGVTSLAFLVHPALTDDEIAHTCATIDAVFS